MPNAHLAAVKAAQRTSAALGVLFGQLGTLQHPRGAVLTAYRNARLALAQTMDGYGFHTLPALGVLAGLRATLEMIASSKLTEAGIVGQVQALAELQAWGVPFNLRGIPNIDAQVQGWYAQIAGQLGTAEALILSGADPAMLLGDKYRVGMLQPGPTVRAGAGWLATAAIVGWLAITKTAVAATEIEIDGVAGWGKQVIAAIDERTTDCCLQAHGQVQPFDDPFILTGTPRYADELTWTPFHWYCRSSPCMVPLALAEDGMTRAMRAAAQAEIDAREETGQRVEIHPASALSRR